MLQTIRERTQGWIAGVIISIIILTFALWGIHSYFIGGGSNTAVVSINGTEISKEQLSAAYDRLRKQIQSQFPANAQALANNEIELKQRALKSLIEVEVAKQAAISQGFRISNDQIDGFLEAMPEFQVNGQFSMDRFQEALATSSLSTSEFFDLIRTSLLIDQPKLGIISTSFSLPEETNNVISLINQEREITYLNIPVAHFLTEAANIPVSKIQSYYNQHKNLFMTPEQVNIDYIQLSIKDLSSKIHPTDSILENFYNENINSYSQPSRWKLVGVEVPFNNNSSADEMDSIQEKATAISDVLKNGGNINKYNKNYSSPFVSKDWMTLNQVPAELQKNLSGLDKAGFVSDPIKTKNGFVVFKVVDYAPSKIQAFEEVKDKIKESYIRQHAEEKFAELRDKLADITYEHPDNLEFASKTLNLPILTSEMFSKDKAGGTISQSKKIRDVAFSNEVLNLQNNSDVIQINPETLIVLRIKSHVQATLLPLNSVSSKIEEKLKLDQAEMAASQFAENLKIKLEKNQNVEVSPFAWNQIGLIGRYSNKVDSAILDKAFRMPHPENNDGRIQYGVAKTPTGYAVISLKSVKNGVVADKEYSVFSEQVQNSDGLLEYELYKKSLINNATIKIYS